MAEKDSSSSFDSFVHFTKFEDIGEFVDILLQINSLRKQGKVVRSREEVPDAIQSIRSTLEVKEGEAKKIVHQLFDLVERHARMAKGEGSELIEEVPEEARAIVKKGLIRLAKSLAYGEETGVKSYDWRIEKEISNNRGKSLNENLIVMEITEALPKKIENTKFVIKGSEFDKFHETLTELREKALQMLGE